VTSFEAKLWSRETQILGFFQITAPSLSFNNIDLSQISLQVETDLCVSGNRVPDLNTNYSTMNEARVPVNSWSITGDVDNIGMQNNYFGTNDNE